MDINVPEKYRQEAYDLIRSIYKFIPYYNQIKGTYLGMQFILNMMGLCATITELWSTREHLENFSDDNVLFREDEIYAVRRFIDEVGKSNVKDYFLTSRFDVDIYYNTGITLREFNGMAGTIIDVILKIRPVTRCLRRLYFILLINTLIHFNYYLDNEKEEPEIKTFNYIWNVTGDLLSYYTKYNEKMGLVDRIFIPFLALDAIYYNDGTHTLKNSYFNLFDLDIKLRKSQWKTLRFKLYVREKSEIRQVKTQEYILNIGSDVNVKMHKNGIFLDFNGNAKTILGSFFKDVDLSSMDVFFATTFSMVMGTKYIFQDPNVVIDWDIQELMNEYPGLIEEKSPKYDPVFLIPEKYRVSEYERILVYEKYRG